GVRLKLLDQGEKAVLEAGQVEIAGGTQGAARLGDEVTVTIPAGAIVVVGPAGASTNPAPLVVTGTITGASAKVRIG
ncbi:hypothetical protein OFB92_32805, partial [Escherichia coli]|nr:hypothetical protein [Escherichia coli]